MKKINLITLIVIIILVILAGCDQDVAIEKDNLFTEGVALVQKNDKWGFVDKDGKEVIETKYDNAKSFSEELAAVSNEKDKTGYINKQGEIVIDYKFDIIQYKI